MQAQKIGQMSDYELFSEAFKTEYKNPQASKYNQKFQRRFHRTVCAWLDKPEAKLVSTRDHEVLHVFNKHKPTQFLAKITRNLAKICNMNYSAKLSKAGYFVAA